MKYLALVILLALAPLSWGQELLSETPYYCSIEYSGGVKTATDTAKMSPARFKVNPNEDFRLMPRSALSALISEAPPYSVVMNDDSNSYFLRRLSEDPKDWLSWSGCAVERAYGQSDRILCSGTGSNFVFWANTGRFAYSHLGSWHQATSDSEYAGDDAYFYFGTCQPYYD